MPDVADRTVDVDLDRALELVEVDLVDEPLRAQDPGVAHEHVEPAELLRDDPEQPGIIGLRRHVGGNVDHPSSGCARSEVSARGTDVVGIASDDDHVGTLA